MTEIPIEQVRQKSLRGIVALIQRSFLLQLISAGSTIVLAYYFDSSVFGVFSIVSAVISFLAYFSDVGLAASLIQKKERLTDEDLATTFTIQQLLVSIIILVALAATPLVQQLYGLDQRGIWLYWAVIASFLLSSLKTIPSILLERSLDFQKLVIPQIVETFVFNAILIIMAIQGFGVTSYTVAVVLRGITGLVLLYIISPWRIRIGISKKVARQLFSFGIPFQTNSLLALVKDDLLFLVLGRLLTLDQMGFIYLAKRLAELPLRNIMDNVMKVTFPAFSRLQHSKVMLSSALEKSIFGISLIVFPLYTGMIFFITPFMALVPRYQKWEPALLSFYFLCISSMFASITTPLTNALNAIGKIKVTLGFMIMWIILTWILVLTFISRYGYHGFALALMFVSLTFFVVVSLVKRYIELSVYKQCVTQMVASLVMAGFFYGILQQVAYTAVTLTVVGVFGLILYTGIVWYFKKEAIYALINAFKHR